ncbi:hypothetical protein GCM10009676_19830 [Prauserella halophila]|uniref:Lipoprotein with Yx(FWY)xxD motif n=1 Tax=Prauserella halophila TaxID=185641 RepID=A0ABN1W4X6_9PSEU|nr:hypothetical protein [Prauserella halophila]MCP2235818.1 putative lipoprotein with conserved Yx(FWY)xxD motif [Prauserella halophila]
MKTRHTLKTVAAPLLLLTLSACGAGDGGNGGYGAPPATGDGDSGDAPGLRTADTELGTIVVDDDGMVLYQFDSDERGSGTSTCEGQCAQNWPAVPGEETPDADGISGDVDTITGVDGRPQLTLNGWPLYYYAGDQEPGDLSGQGVGDAWWVLTPEGEPVRG